MIGNKKVIGVCITKIHNRTRADFINRLHYIASFHNYKLIVFNSVVDFYYGDEDDAAAKSVYDLINYDLIDALIVLQDKFSNKEITAEIISRAKSHNIPVVITGESTDGCYCIKKEYTESFKKLIRHVICDHNARDTFFIAGRKENDEVSDLRIQCYKDVLAENNIPFDENNLDYGEYWNIPTWEVLDRILQREKLPQAIICANDSMAIAVIEKLQDQGYNVPENVIVTGFDGLPDADYIRPKLTTCKENMEQFAQMCISLIHSHFEEGQKYGDYAVQHIASISNSCGCKDTRKNSNNDASYIFHMMYEMEYHEGHTFSYIDKMMSMTDLTKQLSLMSQCMIMNSSICLKSDFINSSMSDFYFGDEYSDELTVIPYTTEGFDSFEGFKKIHSSDIIPDLDSWADDDTSYVLSAIFAGGKVYGYYAVKSNDFFRIAHMINRMSKTINIVITAAVSTMKQKFMQLTINNAEIINPVTKLPNLKGAAEWFDKFSLKNENKNKYLAVSVYSLPKYKYIYENYGIKDTEEALINVGKLLKKANPTKSFIAHISEDEFLVINIIKNHEGISETINAATSCFFTEIEDYNSKSSKDYFVEVNCGCTVADPGWNESLATFIKLARGEMYINRVKMGMSEVVKQHSSDEDNYTAFNMLLEKNLFHYYFQPIIDAKTGEIYAYEALMRTDTSIGMNPLQVLEAAGVYKRLYEIEKATIFNVMERFVRDFRKFGGKKVFINSIPGYGLNFADSKAITEKYAEFMEYFVFEITELNSVSDDELDAIKTMGRDGGTNQIAIDDYGTGHSNIVNLLRYKPHIVKIDRFLISGIENDINKQMFVRSTIEFARMNNINVLAEGVETAEELKTVIEFGVDFVQGFYTGRPAPEPILEIHQDIKSEILQFNEAAAYAQND